VRDHLSGGRGRATEGNGLQVKLGQAAVVVLLAAVVSIAAHDEGDGFAVRDGTGAVCRDRAAAERLAVEVRYRIQNRSRTGWCGRAGQVGVAAVAVINAGAAVPLRRTAVRGDSRLGEGATRRRIRDGRQ